MSSRKLYSKTSTESRVYIAQHVSQIAKQMDAALRGLHKTPDTKVKFTFIYLGVSVNMMNKTEHV